MVSLEATVAESSARRVLHLSECRHPGAPIVPAPVPAPTQDPRKSQEKQRRIDAAKGSISCCGFYGRKRPRNKRPPGIGYDFRTESSCVTNQIATLLSCARLPPAPRLSPAFHRHRIARSES